MRDLGFVERRSFVCRGGLVDSGRGVMMGIEVYYLVDWFEGNLGPGWWSRVLRGLRDLGV